MDTHGQPTFLYITDTQRKAAVVEREFLAQRADKPVFSPAVRVLSDILTELWERHGTGRAILSRRACAIAGEKLLTERGDDFPWLASLGRPSSVGTALADLLRTASEARQPRLGGFPRAAELNRALHALAHRLDHVSGHIRESEALEALLARLHSPPPALTEWLRSRHSVVLDDILMPSPLRRALLVALCRAWESVGTHVVIAFETGRDLGGREAGLFFGYDDVDDVAYPLKPFTATRALRRELFDHLVAEGDGEILVGLDDAVLRLDPGMVPDTTEPPDLTDWMYASEPVPVTTPEEAAQLLGDTVRVVRCEDAESELRFIARGVKRALLDGARPDECVVALPDLATYGPALQAVFDDHGIPFTLSAGARLAHSPVANALRRLATVAAHGWRVDEVLPLLRSELLSLPVPLSTSGQTADAGLDPAQLLTWCRAAGVSGGEPEAWKGLLHQWVVRDGWREHNDPHAEFPSFRERVHAATTAMMEAVDAAVDAVISAIEPLRVLAEPATPEQWADNLLQVADTLGLTVNLAKCPAAPEVAADNLFAWGASLRTIETLVRDLQVVDGNVWPAEALAANLDRALHEATYSRGRGSLAQVQVVGVLELRGLTPTHTWLGGLARGSFPAGTHRPFLVPGHVQRALEPVDRLAESRYLFCSLVRNALDDPAMTSLTLSWPSTVGGRSVPPAPVLADLLSVPTTKSGTLLGDLLVEVPTPPKVPLAVSDLLRSAAREPAWRALADEDLAATLTTQADAHGDRAADRFGRFDAVLDRPPPRPARLTVSRVDTYVKCPMRYWLGAELSLREQEAWDPELGPQRRGVTVHRILQRFVEQYRAHYGDEEFTDKEDETLRPLLAEAAREVIAKERQKGGFDPALFEHDVRVWTSGLDGDGPRGVLCEWLLQETKDFTRGKPRSVEDAYILDLGGTKVEARIDRVDSFSAGGGGHLVLDYKTGGWPTRGLLLRGLAMQPVLYAEAIARAHPGVPVVTAWSLVGRPNKIRRVGWVGPQNLLKALWKDRWGEFMEDSDREVLVDFAEQAVDHMEAGLFHTTLAEPREAGCRNCAFHRMCRVDEERSLRILDTATPAHRPRDPDAGPTDGEDA